MKTEDLYRELDKLPDLDLENDIEFQRDIAQGKCSEYLLSQGYEFIDNENCAGFSVFEKRRKFRIFDTGKKFMVFDLSKDYNVLIAKIDYDLQQLKEFLEK